jgi:SAM-dependent methyltransferase
MEMMRDAIAQAVSEKPADLEPVRITSVGAGPAREVAEYLEMGEPSHPVTFCLIDHEADALAYAESQCKEALNTWSDTVALRPVHLSIGELLRQPAQLSSYGPQQLIYSVGLFDYFGISTCRRLVAGLFDLLAPGGRLIVGNMKANTDMAWPLEFIADWTLNYRTADEMARFADLIDPASVDLHTDPKGYSYLLSLRK